MCVVQGVLKGFDQTVNMILAQSHERVYSSGAGVEKVQLGLYIIRGDNMSVVCVWCVCVHLYVCVCVCVCVLQFMSD